MFQMQYLMREILRQAQDDSVSFDAAPRGGSKQAPRAGAGRKFFRGFTLLAREY
jgi:hypothetical protein